MVKRLLLSLFLSVPCFAASGNIVVNQFSGLDTQDNPASIQPSQSQDLLNVRLQPGGRSVYKRDGYGLFQALSTISTATVHGGYHFQQATGSDVQLWGSDAGLYSIVSDGSAVLVATGTTGATWQCTDNLGFAYCVTSSGIDIPVKTDGTKANTTYVAAIPAGTMVTSTPLQLVVAGVSGNASSVYISSNNAFSSFGTGPLPTDPYIEIINAPGSRITHMAYYFGNIYWWKDQSFGYISGSASQGTVGVTIVSNQIGTVDNSSAFWNPTNYDTGNHFGTQAQAGSPVSSGNPYFEELSALGGIFFRGQDNHIYQYDGYNLTRLSRMITPNVTASSSRKINFWTQTTKGDFLNGAIVPTGHLTLTESLNDIAISTFSSVQNSSTQWNAGTSNNFTISPTSFTLAANNSGNINDNTFENSTGSSGGGNIALSTSWGSSGWGASDNNLGSSPCIPNHGNYCAVGIGGTGSMLLAAITDVSGNVLSVSSVTMTVPTGSCSAIAGSWPTATISSTGFIGRKIKVKFTDALSNVLITTNSYTLGGDITFSYAGGKLSGGGHPSTIFVDDILNGSSTISTGWLTSNVFDAVYAGQTVQLSADAVVLGSTPTWAVQTATSTNGVWATILTSSGTNAIANEFIRYTTTITIGNIQTAISTVTIVTASSGTFYSAVNNAPNLRTFNSFVANGQLNSGSLTYYTRSSTNSFSVLSATPTWISQANNSNVSASTGTYFQARVDFATTSSTATPVFNDFTFNWFEGVSLDKAYITYFQDAIWFGVSSSSNTSSNNTIFYLDLLNSAWLKDNIASNGFAIENNSLYIGDPLTSNIYKFGGYTADNNSSIQSYWKSMDFTGADPTTQNEFQQADFSFAESSNTIAYTFDLDQSTSSLTTINIPLYSSKSTIIKRGLLLPVGKIGTFYNFQIGDNSILPRWTLIGHRVKYNPLNWIPQTSG